MKHTILTFIVSSLLSCGAPAYALDPPVPNITPLECALQRETPVEAFMESAYLANGLEAFAYDTNGDGKNDVQLMLPQNDPNRYPLYYMFDNNYDGEPDVNWIDHLRDGTCGNIELIWYGAQKGEV